MSTGKKPSGWCDLSGLPEPDATLRSAALAAMLTSTVEAAYAATGRAGQDTSAKEHEAACRVLVGLLQRHGGSKGEPEGVTVLRDAFAAFMAKNEAGINRAWDETYGEDDDA